MRNSQFFGLLFFILTLGCGVGAALSQYEPLADRLYANESFTVVFTLGAVLSGLGIVVCTNLED